MANINLRVGNDALTFAEVDSNFTNLNSESFYGGITFTSGVLKFEPIGSDGTGETDPYPPIEFNLDNTYLNQVSSTDFSDLNSIAKMPDDAGLDTQVDAFVDSAGFVSPDDKLLISDQGRLLYNSPSLGVNGVEFAGVSPYGNGDTGSWLAHPNFIDEQFLTDYFQYDASTGTITIDATTNGGLLNRYDEVAGEDRRYAAGYAGFIAQMNHMKGSDGVILALYSNDTFTLAYRRKITGVTYAQSNGENTAVTITTEASPEGNIGNPSGNNIRGIQVVDAGAGYNLKLLKSPRAPLTPPITPPSNYNNLPFAQVMIPNFSRRIDQADLVLSYGDDARLVCQGLASKGNMTIKPVTTKVGVRTASPLLGSQLASEQTGVLGSKSLELYGGDIDVGAADSTGMQGGDLTLGGGVNTYRTQSGAVSPAADNTKNTINAMEDYSALTDFSDSSRPLIKLFGRQSYTNTKENSIVISAGRNYRESTGTASNFQNRVGGDIRFLLGAGSGQGAPGDLVIEALDVPTASTTVSGSNAHNKPNNSADVNPFKIEWDSDNYEYKTKIPNIDGKIKVELAEITNLATLANHPFDTNADNAISGADSLFFQKFASGIEQSGINIEQGTIVKGVTKTNYDTDGTKYDHIYELDPTIDSITPRLMMFSGSTFDVLRNSVGIDGRNNGDLIMLGNVQVKTNNDVRFLNGLSIDGAYFSLLSTGGSGIRYTDVSLAISNGDTEISLLSGAVDISSPLSVTGDINATGDVTAFSDESIKENVEVIEDAVDKVQQLNGYTFDRTDIETSRQTGVIAQEVLKVLPEAVGEKDGLHTVAYGNMVGLLIEAIKEQQGQIDSLKEELQSIKSINK